MLPGLGNVGETSLTKLQKLQNRAARIVTGSRYDQSALPLIRVLGWPTVREILDLETLKMVFKSLNSDAPSYMSDMFTRVSETTSRALRNSNKTLGLQCEGHQLVKDTFHSEGPVSGMGCRMN